MPAELVVSTDWLVKRLDDPAVRVVDIRGYVTTRAISPGVEQAEYRGARDEYLAAHIPGATYIDWTADIIDPDDPVPVQIAAPARFAEAMAVRGIGDGTQVVAVDHGGGQFATRLWWALTYYGHAAVSVLDGGWNAWVREGRPVEGRRGCAARARFTPRPRPERRVTATQVLELLNRSDPAHQLVDARDPKQYSGATRRGERGGHIPGAKSVPRELFFEPGGGFLPVRRASPPRARTRSASRPARHRLLQRRCGGDGRALQPGAAGLSRSGQLRRLLERVGQPA